MNSDGPKIIDLPKDADRAKIDAMVREMPVLLESAVLMARAKRAYYVALMSEGFTAEQALELCKNYMGV